MLISLHQMYHYYYYYYYCCVIEWVAVASILYTSTAIVNVNQDMHTKLNTFLRNCTLFFELQYLEFSISSFLEDLYRSIDSIDIMARIIQHLMHSHIRTF